MKNNLSTDRQMREVRERIPNLPVRLARAPTPTKPVMAVIPAAGAVAILSRGVGSTPSMAVRWDYPWKQVALDATNKYAVVSGGLTDASTGMVKARNRTEDPNDQGTILSGLYDFALPPFTANAQITLQAVRNVVVIISFESLPNGTLVPRFSAPNGVQGACG